MITRPLLCRLFACAMLMLTIATTSYGQEPVSGDSIVASPASPGFIPQRQHMPDAAGFIMPGYSPSPTLDALPAVPRFSPGYYPDFYPDKSPLQKGEYDVSGILKSFDRGAIYGMGSQDNLIGMGAINQAALGYMHQFNDRLSVNFQLNATKFSVPHFRTQAFGSSGSASYRLNERLSLKVFGSYSAMTGSSFRTYEYGGTMDIGMGERFGTEIGVRRYYNSANGRWETVPIVISYYKFDKFTLGADVGGLLFHLLQNAFDAKGRDYGPTIMPQRY